MIKIMGRSVEVTLMTPKGGYSVTYWRVGKPIPMFFTNRIKAILRAIGGY